MALFQSLSHYDFGEVHLVHDRASQLRAIVAIHDTRRGPALGGCRLLDYKMEADAFDDALRLARAMTYKAAITDLALGGGKSVLLRPPGQFDRRALLRAFGTLVEHLGGRYITAEDSGTSVEDMEIIRSTTSYVTGVRAEGGGTGDPSPFTALGVRRGIEACVAFALGRNSLDGLHVAVQGVGHVGYHLCRELSARGATLTVADIDQAKTERVAKEFGARVADLDALHRVECDVFSPCALGSVLNDKTIPQLACRIVAGGANNQLAAIRHGEALMNRGIVYAPDYAINAGGLICVAQAVLGYGHEEAVRRTERIYETLFEIVERAAAAHVSTQRVADNIADERLTRT